MILATIMKSFTTGVSRTFWWQWHAPPALCGWITGKGNLSRAEKIFYQENSVTWEDFLTIKVQLWIDTRSSIGNTLHGSGRAVEKVVYCFRSKKHLKKVVVILCATCLALKMQWPTKCHRSQRYSNDWKVIEGRVGNFFEGYQPRIMHGVGLDQCEIRARNDFNLTVNKSLPLA